MTDNLLGLLDGLSKEVITMLLAAMPISELRGAIPVGVALGLSLKKAFWLSVLGNLLPVCPILYLLTPISERFRDIPMIDRFFQWFFERTKRKAKVVERYEALGLILFVAMPLPVTGAWTGCVAASIFKIRFRYAFFSIATGVFVAGCIVSGLVSIGYKVV